MAQRRTDSLTCLGAVLAGGRSRRMGSPKAGLRLANGRPMIEHVLDSLRAVCREVAIVGECRGYDAPEGVTRLADLRPGSGPLAGLEALLHSGLARGYLVAACDQPFLTPELLRRLLPDDPHQGRMFRTVEFHPFPGYYPAAWLPRVEDALDRGEFSMRSLLSAARVEWVRLGENDLACLRNLNRPADLAACGLSSE